MKKQKPKAIVVGGSIAGESCAKALVSAGWDVVVIEKTRGPPTQNPTGAGLGLDPLAQKIVQSWLHEPELLYNNTLPVTITEVYNIIYLISFFPVESSSALNYTDLLKILVAHVYIQWCMVKI